MKKLIYLLLAFCAACTAVSAQTSANKKAQGSFDKAQAYLRNDQLKEAAEALDQTVKADPAFQYAFIQLGDIHRRLKAFAQAKSAYQQAINLNPEGDPRMFYGMAEACIFTGSYSEALENISRFLSNYKGKDPDFLKKAEEYRKDVEFAVSAIKSPLPYEPVNLGPDINSSYREYFPSLTADGLQMIFSRTVDGNEDFFTSLKKNGTWGKPAPLSDQINTSKFNEGAQSLSADGKYLFFTGCNRPDGLGRCDIYVSQKTAKGWGEPFNLGAPLNSVYWDAQPSVSPDGNTLYFVSNRPGGLGGYDIWKSTLKSDGYWDQPVNLGPEINTPGDEQTPFLHPDGHTLYFSSDGWPGMGNKDIFLSRLDNAGKWGEPVNLGYPINTFNEETGLIVSPEGTDAFFSSDLKGGYGDLDIYSFKMPETVRPVPIVYVKGTVKDKTSRQPLEADIRIINLNTKKTIYQDFTDAGDGSFLAVMPTGAAYAFNAAAAGYVFYSENYQLNSAGSREKPSILEIYLEKLKPGSNVIMKNIFFDTNAYQLLPYSESELDMLISLLKQNPGLRIEIQGHTDNVGKDEDNRKLSTMRARSVYEYLISRKILPDRLTYKGLGESVPVATNDTEAGRKLNRRTSFVVTGI